MFQKSYDLIIEDVVVFAYNKEYFTEPDVYVDDSNGVTANITIIKQLPPSTEVINFCSCVIKLHSSLLISVDIGFFNFPLIKFPLRKIENFF